MPKIFIIIIFFLLSLILYLSDSFVYPIEEVEITSTTSNYDTEKINDIVASIQGQDLLSLDLGDNNNLFLVESYFIYIGLFYLSN